MPAAFEVFPEGLFRVRNLDSPPQENHQLERGVLWRDILDATPMRFIRRFFRPCYKGQKFLPEFYYPRSLRPKYQVREG